jgi:hypothetical protein
MRHPRVHKHQQKLRELRREVKAAVSRAKNKWIGELCKGVNAVHGKAPWECVKQLKKEMQKTQATAPRNLRREDGSGLAESPEENAGIFARAFGKLYGRTPAFSGRALDDVEQQRVQEMLGEVPEVEEVHEAVKKLNLSGPGASGVHATAMKALMADEGTTNLVVQYVREFWRTGTVPEEWEVGELKILPKKGDLSLPKNYRGIMLLEVSYKVVANIMQRRLTVVCESLPHESQCGFRPFRGCNDGVFSVRQMLRKRAEHGLETWVLFLDLVKAFDRVPRELLWGVLLKLGVPGKLVDLLKALHARVKVKFAVQGVEVELESVIGVKQGDILGPILFVLYMCRVMMAWRKKHPEREGCVFRSRPDFVMSGRKSFLGGEFCGSEPRAPTVGKKLDGSEYADDCAVLYPSRDQTSKYAPLLVVHFADFGMEVHVGEKGECFGL